jgi:hypothetical protein
MVKDCADTETFLKEWKRVCELSGDNCEGCAFKDVMESPIRCVSCQDFVTLHPDQAVERLQKWSDTHAEKTLLDKFKEEHPTAPLYGDNGVPKCNPVDLGYLPMSLRDYSYSLGENSWFIPVDDIIDILSKVTTKESAESSDSVEDNHDWLSEVVKNIFG